MLGFKIFRTCVLSYKTHYEWVPSLYQVFLYRTRSRTLEFRLDNKITFLYVIYIHKILLSWVSVIKLRTGACYHFKKGITAHYQYVSYFNFHKHNCNHNFFFNLQFIWLSIFIYRTNPKKNI